MKTSPRWFPVILLFVIALASYAAVPEAATKLGPNSFGLTYTPMPNSFKFKPKATINGWVRQNDTKAMIQHGWELWGGLTTMISQNVDGKPVKVPIFETWVDESTVFPSPTTQAVVAPTTVAPGTKARKFSLPRQVQQELLRTQATAFKTFEVVSVKYTKEIYDHVQKNGYYKTATMETLNASWDKKGTPLANRVVVPFPNTSIMLKPTYQVVSGSAVTTLTYWTGPTDSSNPSSPDPGAWNKKMLVVPPGVAKPDGSDLPLVGIDQFYSIKLNKEEAKAITSLGQGTANEGDYALLVAMHVSSREIDNWTWQTFWWSFDKPAIPKSQPPVALPFDHYNIAVGYSYTTGPDSPEGLNVVCYNPYLEAGFSNKTFPVTPGQLGIESNCMSCHRTAAWPPPSYVTDQPGFRYFTGNGLIKPGDNYFKGMTKVDFVWGFAVDVNPPGPAPSPSP
jgi:hypothetical protein